MGHRRHAADRRGKIMARKRHILSINSELSAFHDGKGWCIKAESPGEAPYLFGGYAIDAQTAHWAAGEVAKIRGCKVAPLRLN
jgi:hypothetical protein